MKKTSIALLLGLFAVGCEGPKPPPAAAPITPPDPAQMMMRTHQPPGAPAAGGATEEKKPDAPAEGEKPAGDAAPADAPK